MFMIPIKSVNATLMFFRIINYKSDESTKSNKKIVIIIIGYARTLYCFLSACLLSISI